MYVKGLFRILFIKWATTFGTQGVDHRVGRLDSMV